MVQYINLRAQYERIKDDVTAGIHDVLEDGRYILGPAVTQLEDELKAFSGCKHVVSCSSGTDALVIPLLAKEMTAKDAVFVPAFTYTATAEAILLGGATPVFVDVDEKSFNIDVDNLKQKISEVKAAGKLRPAAIMPVDLYGQPADYDALNALAEEEGMFIIADAAQGLGGSLDGKQVGALTQCTGTSFYPSKPLGCYGDGGAIFTDDDDLAAILRSVRGHGQGKNKYDVVRVGMNGRLDSIQAAILSPKLKIFAEELELREKVAKIYDAQLADVVDVPWRVPNSTSAWAQYTIKTDDREALQASLKEDNIPSMVFYPQPMHFQPAYKDYGDGAGSMPISEKLCSQVMSLPMYPYMPEEDTNLVCEKIRAHFGK